LKNQTLEYKTKTDDESSIKIEELSNIQVIAIQYAETERFELRIYPKK
jgi:hypothetical protein